MMQKIIKLLEKNVQWGTLALGAAFLFYMIWSYVFGNPAAKSVNIGGVTQSATPANVDRLIVDGPVAQLEQKIHADNSGFQLPVPASPALNINTPTTQPLAVASLAWDSWELDPTKLSGGTSHEKIAQAIQALPLIPAVHYLDNEPLRTILSVTDAAGVVTTHDQDAVTTFWSVPLDDLIAAYQAPFALKLPPLQRNIYFAHADLIRQELQPDGAWGPDVIVARVFNEKSPPRPPYPGPNDAQTVAQEYRNWLIVAPNQRSIVNADFPPVAAQNQPELQWQSLEAWVAFRAKMEAEENAPIPQNPATPPKPNPTPAPVGPRPLVQPQQLQQPQMQQPSNPFSPSGGGRGYGRGGRSGRQGGAAPTVPPPAVTPVQPAAPLFGPAPTTAPVAPPPPVVQVPIPTLPKLQLVPAVDFTLNAIQSGGDIEFYFHDLTVQDGKTYRYRVRYSILNPVYDKPDEVTDAAFAKVFAIESPLSEWSAPIAVAPRTKFWCSAKQIGSGAKNGAVAFSVFSWHNGKWDEKDFPGVAPGDEIGDANFATHWTLVDTRQQRIGSARFALIVSDDGANAQQRNVQTDATSHEFQHMMADFKAQTAGAPGASPPAGGQQPAGPNNMLPGS